MKKKVIISVVAIAVCCMLALFIIIPLLSSDDEGYDKSKTQIFISVNNGGYGLSWIQDIAKEYSATNAKYEIIIKGEKVSEPEIMNAIKSGTAYDAYFTTGTNFNEGIYSNYFEDLSDILASTAPGDTVKIEDKLQNKDRWIAASQKNGAGCYMLPYADSILGYVFDYKQFVENGWLNFVDASDSAELNELIAQGFTYTISGSRVQFVSSMNETNYKTGDFFTTKGRDGLYDTYDDGQPDTIAEWDLMLAKIVASGSKSFLWTGKYDNYCDEIFLSVLAQYLGYENYLTFLTYDSNGRSVKLNNGTQVPITIDNGYQVYSMDGIKQTFEFVKKYMDDSMYYNPNSIKNGTSNIDAQNLYLLGLSGASGSIPTAMLVEGVWWENEAKTMFKTLYSQGKKSFEYGTGDYRYMLFPQMENSFGLDGSGNGSIMCSKDTGAFVVTASTNQEKLNTLKEFIVLTLNNENLAKFTTTSGSMRPYDYSLTDTQYQSLSKFSKTVINIYQDKSNVNIIKPQYEKINPMRYASTMPQKTSFFPLSFSGVPASSALSAVRRATPQVCMEIIASFYNATDWLKYVSEAKAQGFYN